MVTKDDAEAILAEPKVIAANLTWRRSRSNIYTLNATALAQESGELLTLTGYAGEKNHSFALLMRNSPIRKWTVHDRHRDPSTGIVYRGSHKHLWDDQWRDNQAYVPTDIRIGDINEELMDFLTECNIDLRGQYQPIRRRTGESGWQLGLWSGE